MLLALGLFSEIRIPVRNLLSSLDSISLRKPHMEFITVMARDQLRGTAQSQSNIAKTSNTLTKTVGVLKHLSKGREKQVDDTVDKTHVQRHDDTNRALVEELDRTGDNIFQEGRERQGGFASTVDVGVSGFLAHAGCFSF